MSLSITPADRVIVALDFAEVEQARTMMRRLKGTARYVKVGMQLFYLAGPYIIEECKQNGYQVFVDLKVHDIPNTARGAMRSLAALGADMVNLHATGGKAMMEAAREGLEQGTAAGQSRPLLLGVTQLTSTSREMMNQQIGIPGSVEETVERYAVMTKEAGLDGVVASPMEVEMIKRTCGSSFITVTPGVRPTGSEKGDQQRVTTPADAFRKGTDYIVVGRPVTQSEDPAEALKNIIDEIIL